MRTTEPLRLKKSKSQDGTAAAGLWENSSVRMELVDGSWRFDVPLREIGKTGFYEFRSIEMGGQWHPIGTVPTRNKAVRMAEFLVDGSHVYKPPYSTDLGQVPGTLKPWTDVSEEIARHPSVTGD